MRNADHPRAERIAAWLRTGGIEAEAETREWGRTLVRATAPDGRTTEIDVFHAWGWPGASRILAVGQYEHCGSEECSRRKCPYLIADTDATIGDELPPELEPYRIEASGRTGYHGAVEGREIAVKPTTWGWHCVLLSGSFPGMIVGDGSTPAAALENARELNFDPAPVVRG